MLVNLAINYSCIATGTGSQIRLIYEKQKLQKLKINLINITYKFFLTSVQINFHENLKNAAIMKLRTSKILTDVLLKNYI
jgi:hypothetical protein